MGGQGARSAHPVRRSGRCRSPCGRPGWERCRATRAAPVHALVADDDEVGVRRSRPRSRGQSAASPMGVWISTVSPWLAQVGREPLEVALVESTTSAWSGTTTTSGSHGHRGAWDRPTPGAASPSAAPRAPRPSHGACRPLRSGRFPRRCAPPPPPASARPLRSTARQLRALACSRAGSPCQGSLLVKVDRHGRLPGILHQPNRESRQDACGQRRYPTHADPNEVAHRARPGRQPAPGGVRRR